VFMSMRIWSYDKNKTPYASLLCPLRATCPAHLIFLNLVIRMILVSPLHLVCINVILVVLKGSFQLISFMASHAHNMKPTGAFDCASDWHQLA